jgi:hypothetical protein
MVDMVEHVELGPPYEYDGLGFKVPAATLLFEVRNRLPGWWVCEEVIKRDPKLASNPGNHFHDAWMASFAAEAEHEKRRLDSQESAKKMWETARRNPALMERVARRMEAGDPNAWQEFSPETMMKHALKESPRELKQKDYWRSI